MEHFRGPVVLVEPFGRGGGPDIIGRLLVERLTAVWGVPVTLENRPGEGATAAAAFVAAAVPDGRTLLLNTSAHVYSAVVRQDLPYDPMNDFIALAPVTSQSYVLVAPAASGMRTLDDLVAAALARPGQLRFASTGIGTGTHLSVEQLNADLGISATHAPPTPTDSITETIARVATGAADYAMAPISMVEAHLSSGTLVSLGVSGARRSRLLPEVPTIAEAGVAGFDFPIWYGIWSPAATPAAMLEHLRRGITQALSTTELRTTLSDHGGEPMLASAADFTDFVEREASRARRIAEAAGIAILPDHRPDFRRA